MRDFDDDYDDENFVETCEQQQDDLDAIQEFKRLVLEAWTQLTGKLQDADIDTRLKENVESFFECYVDPEISVLEREIERIEQVNAEDENREHRTY